MLCVQLLAILTITVSGIRLHHENHNLEWTSDDGRSFLEVASEAFHQRVDQTVLHALQTDATADATSMHAAKQKVKNGLGPLGAIRSVVRGAG